MHRHGTTATVPLHHRAAWTGLFAAPYRFNMDPARTLINTALYYADSQSTISHRRIRSTGVCGISRPTQHWPQSTAVEAQTEALHQATNAAPGHAAQDQQHTTTLPRAQHYKCTYHRSLSLRGAPSECCPHPAQRGKHRRAHTTTQHLDSTGEGTRMSHAGTAHISCPLA